MRTSALIASMAALLLGAPLAARADAPEIQVYKSPKCGCCSKWVEHLEDHGFQVTVHEVPDVTPMKLENGIPYRLSSCHTAFVGGYVIEGHVPAADIARLLEQRPPISGLAVPGMPVGSPGMEGPNPVPYQVLAFDHDGQVAVFSSHNP
jgi:hypothetical protein